MSKRKTLERRCYDFIATIRQHQSLHPAPDGGYVTTLTRKDMERMLGIGHDYYDTVRREADKYLTPRGWRLITPTAPHYYLGITQNNEETFAGDANQAKHLVTRVQSELRHAETNLSNAKTPAEAAKYATKAANLKVVLLLAGQGADVTSLAEAALKDTV